MNNYKPTFAPLCTYRNTDTIFWGKEHYSEVVLTIGLDAKRDLISMKVLSSEWLYDMLGGTMLFVNYSEIWGNMWRLRLII